MVERRATESSEILTRNTLSTTRVGDAPLLGGRREVKKSLHTDQRRIALRLARRLSVLLERATAQLMATQLTQQQEAAPVAYLTFKVLEKLVDGSIRMEGVELDPKHAEEDQKLLSALLGTPTARTASGSDTRKLSDLVSAYFDEGDRVIA